MGCGNPLGREVPDGSRKDRRVEGKEHSLGHRQGRGGGGGLCGKVTRGLLNSRSRGLLREGEHRQALEELHRENAGQKGAGGGNQRRSDDGGGVGGSRRHEDADGGGRDQLDGTGIDRQEGAHGVGRRSGTGVERLQSLHGFQAEGCGGVTEAEHVGGDVHHHRSHGGVIAGNVGKEPRQQGPEHGRETLHGARFLCQSHDAEPEGHDGSQRQGDRHEGGLAGLEGRGGHRLRLPGEDPKEDPGQDQSEPQKIEHEAVLRGGGPEVSKIDLPGGAILRFNLPIMSVCPDHWIRKMSLEQGMIEPFVERQVRSADERRLISYGLSSYGYDLRVADEFKVFTNVHSAMVDPKEFDDKSFVDIKTDVCVVPPNSFALARSVEYFRIPRDVLTICVGKSTYARCGIIVNVTPFEPEWEGHVTLEISNTTPLPARIYANEGLAQVVFFRSSEPCETSYADRGGKYMKQTGITVPRM